MQLVRTFQVRSFLGNCHRPPTGSVFQEHMARDASGERVMQCLAFVLFLFLYRRGQQDAKSWGRKVYFGFARRRI